MRLVLFVAALALGACETRVVEAVEGPYYTEGFSDGCRTAEARRAAFDNRSFRNEQLFAAQDSYRIGWREGFADCQPNGIQPVQPTPEGAYDPTF